MTKPASAPSKSAESTHAPANPSPLRDPAKVKVRELRAQAQRLLGGAVVAYARARALKAPTPGFQ